MRFFLGLILGALLGGGATYAALETPWREQAAVPQPDAGPALAADDKKKRKNKKRRKKRGGSGDVEIALTGDVIPELSAADRTLIWKGDAVRLPKRSVDMGGDDDGRPLSGSEINSTVKGQSGSILACITKARGNAQLKAKIETKMLVSPEGKVTKSRFRAPKYLFDHGFYSCARKAAGRMKFPATGAHTVVEVPFDLY